MYAQGMEVEVCHYNCDGGSPCLPIGQESNLAPGGMVDKDEPSHRMAEQIQFEFFRQPSVPQDVIHAKSAQPWEQNILQ